MLERSCSRLANYRKVAFVKRFGSNSLVNKGLLSPQEVGERYTEPEVYRNTTNTTAQIKSERKTRKLLSEERQKTKYNQLGIDYLTQRGLQNGQIPETLKEVQAARYMDDRMIENESGFADVKVPKEVLLKREADRRRHVLDKFAIPPSAREFKKLFAQLRKEDEDDTSIERYQRRLVEENGVYPSKRIDAFMLDNEACFPDWVQALPHSIRDRVKYGSLGLTEEDEALRVRLGRMPLDKRQQEWKRLKAAKEYRAANEEALTPAELRSMRQGKRRFHWLQRKRQHRASNLRRMALRKPFDYEQWPSSAVDTSQRIAFIAQHVENGLETKGQWPLDEEALARQKLKRRQELAERTFLMSMEERKLSQKGVSGGISQILASLDETQKPHKKLSRKGYANRVNAIVHGDQDEYGRKYRKMETKAKHRIRPYDSMAEVALEKELRSEPLVNVSGLHHTDDEGWTPFYKKFSSGMPSSQGGGQ